MYEYNRLSYYVHARKFDLIGVNNEKIPVINNNSRTTTLY